MKVPWETKRCCNVLCAWVVFLAKRAWTAFAKSVWNKWLPLLLLVNLIECMAPIGFPPCKACLQACKNWVFMPCVQSSCKHETISLVLTVLCSLSFAAIASRAETSSALFVFRSAYPVWRSCCGRAGGRPPSMYMRIHDCNTQYINVSAWFSSSDISS